MSDERHLIYLRDLANGGTETILPATLNAIADRIAALEAALRWINGIPLPGVEPDHPARLMQVIATRTLEGKPHE